MGCCRSSSEGDRRTFVTVFLRGFKTASCRTVGSVSVACLISQWNLVTNLPSQVEEYEYQYEGKKRSGTNFICVFVSVLDPCEYCMGQMRWATKDANKFHSVEQKFKDGLAFTMTKVSIVKDAKKDYVHCPIQLVVNVGSTSFSPLLNSSVIGNSYPEPPASIADCSHLTKQQLFDVTALVKSVSKCRPVKDNRVVFDVVILDGSKSDERVRTMPLTVFTERPIGLNSGEPSMWLFLNEASKNSAGQPVSFFRIRGAQDDDGKFSFVTTKNSTIVEAAKTIKGKRLASESAWLLGLTETSSFAVRQYEEGVARDFSLVPATETMCALFGSFSSNVMTGVESIDKAEETFWQLNWVRVEEPSSGSNIRTGDGKRLWFPVTVRDCTGKLTLYIQESAALKLSGFSDADQFETAFHAGKVWFPQMASVKIIRRLKSNSAAQPASQKADSQVEQHADQVDVRIVDAAEQDLGNCPTEAFIASVHGHLVVSYPYWYPYC